MPRDHYVPQVHLRNFYSPILGRRMHGIKKRDLSTFQCSASSVCRVLDGSTNEYLIESRAIEEFLKQIEPYYNKSLLAFRSGEINHGHIYTIAGFIAYIMNCSPAGMRINTVLFHKTLSDTFKILEGSGQFPERPPELQGIEIIPAVDKKYPQAVGINQILKHISMFGNFHWEIIHNSTKSSPFFTSDFPIAIESIQKRQIFNYIIPLAPDLAIKIHVNQFLNRDLIDNSFSNFTSSVKKASGSEVAHINKLIVRSAESLVFYRDNLEWVSQFIAKNRHYRIDTVTDSSEDKDGILSHFTKRIVPYLQIG